ncbi:tyrosine-type recombinase/integrase [soil metagenome]
MKGVSILTPKIVRALTCPEGKRVAYFRVSFDLHLFVQVTATGAKTLVYRRYLNKTWRQMQVADWIDNLDDAIAREILKEASSKAAILHAGIARGENPFDIVKEARNEPTMQDLFELYKSGHLEKRAKRVSDAVNDFKRWFGNFANKKACLFGHVDAEKLHATMSKKTPVSANRAIQLGRAMFNFGLKSRYIYGENPFSGLSLNRESQRDRVLTDTEAGKLLKALEVIPAVHSNERTLRDWVLLSLTTGARKANILSMRWDEIDLNAATWTIPAEKMKTNQTQTIPLNSLELSVLNERTKLLKRADAESPWVFPGSGSKGHIVDPGNAWETLRDKLELPNLWIHDLRRSLASSMANSGADVSIVRAALNHVDTRTTLKAYIRTTQQVQLEARQKAQDGWREAMKRQEQQEFEQHNFEPPVAPIGAGADKTNNNVVSISKAKGKSKKGK